MPRPFKCRRVLGMPKSDYLKPSGIPLSDLREIDLTIDEFEAIRLADLEGLYQEDAAKKGGGRHRQRQGAQDQRRRLCPEPSACSPKFPGRVRRRPGPGKMPAWQFLKK